MIAIDQVLDTLDYVNDCQVINDIEETISKTEELRKVEKDGVFNELKELSSIAANMKAALEKNNRQAMAQEHYDKIAELSKVKAETKSSIWDLKKEVALLQEQVQQLQEYKDILEAEKEDEEKIPPNNAEIKLQISRNMGITVLEDENGEFNRVRVVAKDGVDVMKLGFEESERFNVVNKIWEMTSR